MFSVRRILQRGDALVLWCGLALASEFCVTFSTALNKPEWFNQILLFTWLQINWLPSTIAGCLGAMLACCFLPPTYRRRSAAFSGLLFFPAMYECAVKLGGTLPAALKDFYTGPVFESAATTFGVPLVLGALLFGALGLDRSGAKKTSLESRD